MTAPDDSSAKATRWIIHGERLVDDTRRARVSIAEVELPDGVRFEQWVLRLPRAPVLPQPGCRTKPLPGIWPS